MNDRRELIAIAATIIADAAWLFPIAVVLGMGAHPGQPVLPFFVIMLLMGLGFAAARLAPSKIADPALHAPAQAIAGLGVTYLTLSVISAPYGVDIDLLWGPQLISGGYSGRQAGGLIFAMLGAGFLWHRGVRIAVETHPQLRLLSTFRSGIVALALAIMMEQATGIDASATLMLILFFAASLGGLAFARLEPGGAWTPLVGIAVGAVLGGGFIVGMIAAVIGGHGLVFLAWAWGYVSVVILWLLEIIFTILLWLLPELGAGSGGGVDWKPPKFNLPEYVKAGAGPEGSGLTGELLQFSGLLLALYIAYRLLAWAYQKYGRKAQVDREIDRESIRGEADAKADLLNLFWDLLPDWLRPAEADIGPRYPKDKPGITEVYALYFDMLTTACKHGHNFTASATPRERRADLESAIPGAPVARITDCFNAACYGNLRTDQATVDGLRHDLEQSLIPLP